MKYLLIILISFFLVSCAKIVQVRKNTCEDIGFISGETISECEVYE